MANNRMYLVNRRTLDFVLLAKSFVTPWETRGITAEQLDEAFARAGKLESIATTEWVIGYENGPNEDLVEAAIAVRMGIASDVEGEHVADGAACASVT